MNIHFIEVEKDVTVNLSTDLGRSGYFSGDTEVLHMSLFLLYFTVRLLSYKVSTTRNYVQRCAAHLQLFLGNAANI